MTFDNNTTGKDSGTIYFNDHINAIFKNSSTITLNSNTADSDSHGGAVYTTYKVFQSEWN